MRKNAAAGWLKQLNRLKLRDRTELALLIGGIAFLLLLVVFMKLASEVLEGETQSFDKQILLALRDPADLSHPIGPAWMLSAALDITSLGSTTVLGLTVFLLRDSCCSRACGGARCSLWQQCWGMVSERRAQRLVSASSS